MSQDRKQKLQLGFLFAEVPFFMLPTAATQVMAWCFWEHCFFLFQNIKSPASGLITLPFISQGDSHSPCTLPSKRGSNFFQIKRSKRAECTAGPWTLVLNHVSSRIFHVRRLRWLLMEQVWPFNTLEGGRVHKEAGRGKEKFKWTRQNTRCSTPGLTVMMSLPSVHPSIYSSFLAPSLLSFFRLSFLPTSSLYYFSCHLLRYFSESLPARAVSWNGTYYQLHKI
jgi:hypothetical protein